jgi:hypothetical protein
VDYDKAEPLVLNSQASQERFTASCSVLAKLLLAPCDGLILREVKATEAQGNHGRFSVLGVLETVLTHL